MRTSRITIATLVAVVVTLLTFAAPSAATSNAATSNAATSNAATSNAATSNAVTSAAAARKTTTAVAVGTAYSGLRANLVARLSPAISGGVVTITADGKALPGCSRIPLSGGRVHCTATFGTGTHKVYATFSGTSRYARSTGYVSKTVRPGVGKVVGGTGSCTTSKGALTAVDFAHWHGPVIRGCATTLTSGTALLRSAHFTITNVTGRPFICRLGYPAFERGRRYPTTAQDTCQRIPGGTAYWSFWTARKGLNTWTYSPKGADADRPANGEVELWTFGTTKKPTTTPDAIRAKRSVNAAITKKTVAKPMQHQRRRTHLVAAGSVPDVSAATGYLVGQLVAGTHYETGGNPDYGLTIDGAFALAAAGGHDSVVGAMTDYLAAHVGDYTFLGTGNTQYADGGSIGKLALLAEMTGRDAHSFGGVDLIAALGNVTCASKNVATGCSGKGAYRNTSSTFGQAFGVLAQLRAGATAAAQSPLAHLESLQRSSGGFVSDTSGSLVETDSTAIAAMALALANGTTAHTAQSDALSWLAAQQRGDGGFPGAAGDSVNSAGLSIAALALQATKYSDAIAAGKRFLASVQNNDGGFDVATGQDGSDVRATAEAVSGSLGVPFGSVVDDLVSAQDASSGANYLQTQLVNGDHYTGSYVDTNGQTVTFDDQGLTADGVFALQAAGGHDSTVAAMVAYLRGQVSPYADPTGALGGPYSGSLAKLAVVAESTGGDPHSFGGTDLLAVLKTKECAAAIAGSFSPCTAKGDFYNAFSSISQSFGVLALQASPVAADHLTFDSAPVVRLRQLQCADGGFSSDLITGSTACTSDVDATGYAVQALATVPGTDTALGKAQHFLQDAQRSSGLWAGAAGVNANTTALAAGALQTMVTALYATTGGASGPKTASPVHSWQHALMGLHTLAVPSGGYGLTDNTTADLRASTQAVLAAAQRTLVSLSGADLAAAPRDAATSAPNPPPSGKPATSAAPAGNSAAPIGTRRLANTGVTVGSYLSIAIALIVLGAGLATAGRRPARRRPKRAR